MADVKKYKDLVSQILDLSPEETHQMIFDAETEEEKELCFLINDYVLQRRQAEVIKMGVY